MLMPVPNGHTQRQVINTALSFLLTQRVVQMEIMAHTDGVSSKAFMVLHLVHMKVTQVVA